MLFRVNLLFGFFHSTRAFLKRFSNIESVLDIGCGGGLLLLNLSRLFPHARWQGMDVSPKAIDAANNELHHWKKTPVDHVEFILQETPELTLPNDSIDIVMATLVCHHLTDQELILFLQKSISIARKAVLLNDLHRHPLPYYFYRLTSRLLFRNRLISHDGLLSIRRGFTRKEWQQLLHKAGITHYQIKWCFPFRYQVILWKK
jgi:2-polyprenyl-3-methyl-5-hydroxy-6-metoxy-1,4-benzoquinol methylase